MEEKTGLQKMLMLPLRGMVIFPGMVSHFDVGRAKSVKVLELAMSRREPIFLVSQKDAEVEDPEWEDLYQVGAVGRIKQILKIHGDVFRVLVEGVCRARMTQLESTDPYYSVLVEPLDEEQPAKPTKRDEAMIRNLRELFVDYVDLSPKMNSDVTLNVMENDQMSFLCDYVTCCFSWNFRLVKGIIS